MNIYKLHKDGGGHIGKRWAAGVWCWECKKEAEYDALGCFHFCAKCGARCSGETLAFNPAMRELGFDKTKEIKHKGVDGASGFFWHAKNRKEALRKLKGIKKVKTEYGQYWTIKRFWRMFSDVIKQEYLDSDFS